VTSTGDVDMLQSYIYRQSEGLHPKILMVNASDLTAVAAACGIVQIMLLQSVLRGKVFPV
jgi:hypothetical protein